MIDTEWDENTFQGIILNSFFSQQVHFLGVLTENKGINVLWPYSELLSYIHVDFATLEIDNTRRVLFAILY